MRHPALHKAPVDRANLYFEVRQQTLDATSTREVLSCIASMRADMPDGCALVYCGYRADTSKIAAALKNSGLRVAAFHAGLPQSGRESIMGKWRTGELDVLVGTVAVGMGLDKGNIALVLHYGMPSSMERFMQEAGRGGRNGCECRCVTLASASDVSKLSRQATTPAARAAVRNLSEYFFANTRCRRQGILEYFGEPPPPVPCGGCDVCCGQVGGVPLAPLAMCDVHRDGLDDHAALAALLHSVTRAHNAGHGYSRTALLRAARQRPTLSSLSVGKLKELVQKAIRVGILGLAVTRGQIQIGNRLQSYSIIQPGHASDRFLAGGLPING